MYEPVEAIQISEGQNNSTQNYLSLCEEKTSKEIPNVKFLLGTYIFHCNLTKKFIKKSLKPNLQKYHYFQIWTKIKERVMFLCPKAPLVLCFEILFICFLLYVLLPVKNKFIWKTEHFYL